MSEVHTTGLAGPWAADMACMHAQAEAFHAADNRGQMFCLTKLGYVAAVHSPGGPGGPGGPCNIEQQQQQVDVRIKHLHSNMCSAGPIMRLAMPVCAWWHSMLCVLAAGHKQTGCGAAV